MNTEKNISQPQQNIATKVCLVAQSKMFFICGASEGYFVNEIRCAKNRY